MRMQFLARLTLVGGTVLGATAWSGCDNVTAGQNSDPAGQVKLVRVMVQDADVSPAHTGRAYLTDLLNTGPGLSCDDLHPCQVQFTLAQDGSENVSNFDCVSNVCNDPLKATKVALEPPVKGTAFAGISVRFVFNKLLDDAIQTTTTTGTTVTQKLADESIVSLLDESGAEVATQKNWRPYGSPQLTSDPILIPYGPGLVMNTLTALDSATTYQARLDPSKIKDRTGNVGVTDNNGKALAAPYIIPFTTEDIASSGTNPGKATDPAKAPSVKANDVFQVMFWGAADETTFTGTVTDAAGNPVAAVAYSERGGDATKCSTNRDAKVLNVFPGTVSADGKTVTLTNWAAGTYKLHVVIKDKNGRSTYTSAKDFYFTATTDVGDPAMDKSAVANHLHPAQCTG